MHALFSSIAGCRNSHERLRRLLVRVCLLSPDSLPSVTLMSEHDLLLNGFIMGHSAAAA
jgi:hypothetical protein